MTNEPSHLLCRNLGTRHDQVPLVLAVHIVDDDDELAGLDVGNGVLHWIELVGERWRVGHSLRCCCESLRHGREIGEIGEEESQAPSSAFAIRQSAELSGRSKRLINGKREG